MKRTNPTQVGMKLTDKERQYFRSEQFIHDDLVKRCQPLVETSKRVWKEKNDPSIVILWPAEPIKDADGKTIEDEVLAALPTEDRQARLHRLVDMTKAYGLLVIELQPHALIAIFESPHGAQSWTTRLEQHGDVTVLAKTEERSNVEHLGLLWSPSQGTA